MSDHPTTPTATTRNSAPHIAVIRYVGILLISTFVLWFACELSADRTVEQWVQWLSDRPTAVMLNLAIALSITSSLVFLTNRLDGGCQLALLLLILPVASWVKSHWLLQPLVPADLQLVGDTQRLLPRLLTPGMAMVVLGAITLLVLGSGAAIRRVIELRLSLVPRVLGLCSAVAVPYTIAMAPAESLERLQSNCRLSQGSATTLAASYAQNGFALSMLLGTNRHLAGLGGPSRERIDAIAEAMRRTPLPDAPAVRPDVVVILGESFFDPSDLPGLACSEDPTPNYHALRGQTRDLRLLSPAYGGGTAQMEFELLTGFSMRFQPQATSPYLEQLHQLPTPSIARYFTSLGYRTLSVHPYQRTFYWRDTNHPLLGFARFDAEESFPAGMRKGLYISDEALADRVVAELEGAKRPLFLFAVSMQNHGPYHGGRYGQCDVTVSSRLEPAKHGAVETWVQGLRDTDAMLGRVVEVLRKRERPTILVFFGDHLPTFGPDLSVYRELGFVTGSLSPQEQLRLRAVPAIVWANYPVNLPKQDEVISPGLIWSEVLPAIGMEHPFYTRFLGRVREQAPGVSSVVCVLPDGTPAAAPPADAGALLDEYRDLQHDIMDGRRHGLLPVFGATLVARPQ